VYTQGNIYGLPDNYWSLMGGHVVRRSGSVFLSSQGFALIFVVFLPSATLWAFRSDARRRVLRHLGYFVIWLGLLVTFTRAAIVIGVLQLLAILGIRRRSTSVALAAAVGLVVFLIGMVAVPGLATFVLDTLTWQSGSSASHIKDWTNGVTAFLEQPWGYGLGTADQSAVRGGLEPITSDNLYLKFAVEMGVPGLLLLVGTLAAFMSAGVRLVRSATNEHQRALGITVALATAGVIVYGTTGVIFSDPIVAYLLFWLSGAAVTLSHQRRTAPVPAVAYA
jgi:O-antigen ligase